MNKFFTILTQVGEAKFANATALGSTVKLEKLAVGDGGGTLPTPTQTQTALENEVWRGMLNTIKVDKENANWLICEQVIPEDVGGWTIREVGLYDQDGDLIVVGNFPETYKPALQEGSGRSQTIQIVLPVSSSSSVELQIDSSIVLATREYVDQRDAAHVAGSDPHPQYATDTDVSTLAAKVAVNREYVDQRDAAHVAELDPHPQYATDTDVNTLAAKVAMNREYVDQRDAAHVAELDPHPQYATNTDVSALTAMVAADYGPHNLNISDSVTNISSTVYASSTAVKTANDRGNEAYSRAEVAYKLASDVSQSASSNHVYAGTDPNNLEFPVGTTLTAWGYANRNEHTRLYLSGIDTMHYGSDKYGGDKGVYLNGTWAWRGYCYPVGNVGTGRYERIA